MTNLDQTIKNEIKKLFFQGQSDKNIASKLNVPLNEVVGITKLLPKNKYYYDVRVECMLPATLTYRVLAESPEKAAEMIKGLSPTSVKHKLIGRKESKLMVYDAGSSIIKLIRNLFK